MGSSRRWNEGVQRRMQRDTVGAWRGASGARKGTKGCVEGHRVGCARYRGVWRVHRGLVATSNCNQSNLLFLISWKTCHHN